MCVVFGLIPVCLPLHHGVQLSLRVPHPVNAFTRLSWLLAITPIPRTPTAGASLGPKSVIRVQHERAVFVLAIVS